MINVNRKLLIIIATVISIMLIILLVIVSRRAEPIVPRENEKFQRVENNDSSILHYNGKIYYIDNFYEEGKNYYKLASLPINFDNNIETSGLKPVTLISFGNVQPSKILKIDQDILFYFISGNTYYYSITENIYEKFCDGQLQYLDSENLTYITLYNGNLYRGKYYESTLATREMKMLTSSAMNRKYEDDENIYYYVSMNNALLLGFNKNDFILSTYDTIDTTRSELLEVFSTDKYVLVIVETGDKQYLERINKQTKEKEVFPLKDLYDEITFVKNAEKKRSTINDFYLFATKSEILEDGTETVKAEKYVYTDSKNSLTIYEGMVPGDSIENYTLTADDNTITLFKDDKKITSITYAMPEVENIKLENIEIIGDYLYYEIRLDNIKNIPISEDEIFPEDDIDMNVDVDFNETSDDITTIDTSDLFDEEPVKVQNILARTKVSGGESYQINIK
ncbi:MAG: hypothetical protein IJ215_05595 [Clostridia bacterium]|nr:hypothetical protein [Clostridia bacterium]